MKKDGWFPVVCMPFYTTLTVLSIVHALVDACCALLVFSLVHIYPLSSAEYLQLIVGYNIIAFALQPLCGMVADRFAIPKCVALAGVVATGAALAALLWHPWVTVGLAGLGNALYHVGGGSIVLTAKQGRAAPAGIFVAPGAIGLAAGAYVGSRGVPLIWPFAAVLAVAFVILSLVEGTSGDREKQEALPQLSTGFKWAVTLLLLSVALRSFVGYSAGSVLIKNRDFLYLFIAVAALGKGVGGVIADRYGWLTVGVGALLLSGLFMAIGSYNAGLALAGMLLFQMTMPVTLTALFKIFPGRPGLAFGLCCLALIVGAAPVFTPLQHYLHTNVVLLPGILFCTITFFAGLRHLPTFRSVVPIAESGGVQIDKRVIADH